MAASHRSRNRTKEERLKGFWIHLAVYIVVNAGLIALDLFNGPEKTWFYWPLGGWGIGIVCHAWAVFLCHRRERRAAEATAQLSKPAHQKH